MAEEVDKHSIFLELSPSSQPCHFVLVAVLVPAGALYPVCSSATSRLLLLLELELIPLPIPLLLLELELIPLLLLDELELIPLLLLFLLTYSSQIWRFPSRSWSGRRLCRKGRHLFLARNRLIRAGCVHPRESEEVLPPPTTRPVHHDS